MKSLTKYDQEHIWSMMSPRIPFSLLSETSLWEAREAHLVVVLIQQLNKSPLTAAAIKGLDR